MSRENIALLHYSCPPVVGGVEEVVRQQASLFFRNHHLVKIIAGTGGQFDNRFEIELNPLLGSRCREIMNLHSRLEERREQFFRYVERIEQYLEQALADFDLLIAHNVLTMHYNLPLTYALHRLADSGKIPVISWNHDSPYFYQNYPEFLDGEMWQILRQFNPNIHYIAISESRKQQFRQLYGPQADLHVIPNGIDPIRFFRLDNTTVRVIQESHLFEAELLLVQPSRLHPRKNIELSIRVIRALQDRGVAARLLLTGAYDPHEANTVDYYRKLKKLARELRVEKDILIMAEYYFRSGEKLSADRIIIRDLYLIADLLFMPSLQEGFGIPLLEAGMIKLPIVCSDIAPFQEIGDGDVVYFGLSDTPETIAEKIMDFLGNLPPHRMYRNVIRNYVWDNIYLRELKPFIEQVVSHR
jgi:glycosyltransferase involved in cell wall biosynthesis